MALAVPLNGTTPMEIRYIAEGGTYVNFDWMWFWPYIVDNNTKGFDRNSTTPFNIEIPNDQKTYEDYIW